MEYEWSGMKSGSQNVSDDLRLGIVDAWVSRLTLPGSMFG